LIPPTDLPVEEVVGALRAALAERTEAVLVAPPGAGKTTLVPLRLVDEPWLGGRRIVMLEPRRLAARAAAHRLAVLTGTEPGGLVGYQTRDERRIGPATRIEVVTEGVLTRRLQSDPELPGVGLVIFDEVHERNLPTDVGLAFALDARRVLRPDLRILAMSATADAERFAAVLANGLPEPAPIIASDGRQFPVDIRWAPPAKGARTDAATADLVRRALREETGDLLVFLPGIGEITRVQGMLGDLAGVDVYPLAGALSLADQDRALAPSPPGRRRVVLSTDIAETSLTVSGVRVVVDAGLARVPRYDLRSGMTKLTTVSTSRASADQRAGRAGRTEPGVAYRLWSKIEHATRRAQLEAEITQVDLAGLALELAAWGTPAADLAWCDPPPPRALAQGRELLAMLGAMDDDGQLTASGRAMLPMPLHPRLAHMVVAASDRDRSLACVLGSLVDERDILRGRPDELPTDIALRVQLVAGDLFDDRADRRAIERIRVRAGDLARRAGTRLDLDALDPERCGHLLLLGYPDRLAARRTSPGQFQLRTGTGAFTDRRDPLAEQAFVVAADVDGDRKNTRIRLAAAIDADDVIATLGDQVEERRTMTWDRDRGDLIERIEHRLGSMRLSEVVRRPQPGAATTAALVDRVRATRLAALGWTPVSSGIRERVRFLRQIFGDPWPDWSDKALIASLDEWLAPYLAGATGAADLQGLDLAVVLRSQLPWPEGADLDRLAPTHWEVANGRRVAIDYSGDTPVLAVRVQQLYGVNEHPTIAGGRVPLQLQLLSPADRPIQITSDLPGFWTGSWADVRKDMAGRYPKHDWPVDPR
jgi:ATP-dependent helicase HrpB